MYHEPKDDDYRLTLSPCTAVAVFDQSELSAGYHGNNNVFSIFLDSPQCVLYNWENRILLSVFNVEIYDLKNISRYYDWARFDTPLEM